MRVQTADFAAALALTLLENGGGLVERPFEERVQFRFAGDLAGDVANGPAERGLEPARRLVGPLELLGVRIALVPDQRQLADPHIGLAQIQPRLYGQPHQPSARPVDELGVGREHHVLRLHSRVCSAVEKVVIANPKQVRIIARAKIKTDTIDAGVLAQLYASGFASAPPGIACAGKLAHKASGAVADDTLHLKEIMDRPVGIFAAIA